MSKAKELSEWMSDFLMRANLTPTEPLSYQQILQQMTQDLQCSLPMADMTPGSVVHTLVESIAMSQALMNQHIDHLHQRINELEKRVKD